MESLGKWTDRRLHVSTHPSWRLYTIHGNQPAIFFIPSSRYYSNDLSNFLQELEAGSTATYAINSRGERERGLVNLHGLSPSALPRYRDRDHSLSLSPLSLTARGQECPLSRACNLLDGRSPRRGSWKTSAFQPSNRGVIRYSCRVLCEIRSPL